MFKIGDKVRRIRGDESTYHGMYLGHIYTVSETDADGFPFIKIKECGDEAWWEILYFELAGPKLKKLSGFGAFMKRIDNADRI